MKWFTTSPPKEEDKAFLAKLNDKYDPYYVLSYCEYDNSFREASGERYISWEEEDILAWTTFDELDKDYQHNPALEKQAEEEFRRKWDDALEHGY